MNGQPLPETAMPVRVCSAPSDYTCPTSTAAKGEMLLATPVLTGGLVAF
jgi:hypothetical protein